MASKSSYWLLKTEPSTYSFATLQKEGRTNWNGIRNFQARNFLKLLKKNDLALIYHSGDEKAVVGIARVVTEAYPDPDANKPGEWVQIDLEPVEALSAPVPLSAIRSSRTLADLPLIRQSRLSVMPISEIHFKTLCDLRGGER
ncbi:MAG: EVE domain-containing protein [Bdellovibrionota bacterium]